MPGAIRAVPFLAVVKAVTDNVEALQVVNTFLASDPYNKTEKAPNKATKGPALNSAPIRNQAEARDRSPPTVARESELTPEDSLMPGIEPTCREAMPVASVRLMQSHAPPHRAFPHAPIGTKPPPASLFDMGRCGPV